MYGWVSIRHDVIMMLIPIAYYIIVSGKLVPILLRYFLLLFVQQKHISKTEYHHVHLSCACGTVANRK